MAAFTLIKNKLIIFSLLFFVFLTIASCASLSLKNFGKFVPDDEVTVAFNTARINPDFNYYITGSEVYPRSILGLNKAYQLDSDLWVQVEFTPKSLKELTDRMQQRAIICCGTRPFGFAITDAHGKQIGVWYSILVNSISVKVLDHKVIIFPPNDREYESYDDQGGGFHFGR